MSAPPSAAPALVALVFHGLSMCAAGVLEAGTTAMMGVGTGYLLQSPGSPGWAAWGVGVVFTLHLTQLMLTVLTTGGLVLAAVQLRAGRRRFVLGALALSVFVPVAGLFLSVVSMSLLGAGWLMPLVTAVPASILAMHAARDASDGPAREAW